MLAQSAVMRLRAVCLSVCLSVTFMYCDQIGWNSSKIISPPNSLMPMRSLTPKNRGGGQEHMKAVRSPKRCKIGPTLLLRTNRKSHTRFRLASNSSTLDDLERRKRPSFRNRKVWRSPEKLLNARCSSSFCKTSHVRFVYLLEHVGAGGRV